MSAPRTGRRVHPNSLAAYESVDLGRPMTAQFGAIPVRAFADKRLSAADFRVMGAIAYFDRFGRNGAGCYVDEHKLAEFAAVLYGHFSRHTKRLQEFAYLEIYRSAADRRKRIYALIYNENRVVVANSGDNLEEDEARGATRASRDEKVTTSGDNPAEKVTNAESQVVDPLAKSSPKRLSEAYLRDPAKPRAPNGENRSHAATSKSTNHARQGDRGGGNSRAQRHFMLPFQGGNQQPKTRRCEPDWKGWAKWIERAQGLTAEQAWLWLSGQIDRIAAERSVGGIEAGAILDRQLKRQRKAAA